MAGYVVAETIYVPVPGIGVVVPKGDFWCMLGMASLIAPKDRGIEAAKIMGHSMLSFRINPQWWSQFNAAAQRFTGASIAASQRMTANAQANFQRQQADVATGPYNSYWINVRGTVVSSTLSPGPAFRPLQAATP